MKRAQNTGLLLVLLLNLPLLAIPMPDRTNLPFPHELSEEDEELIYEAMKLQVYPDSEDPNQYYYMPPLHFRQYAYGAANMTLHTYNVKRFAEAKTSFKEFFKYREQYNGIRIKELEAEVEKAKADLLVARKELNTAELSGNQGSIAVNREWVAEEKANFEKVSDKLQKAQEKVANNEFLMPAAFGRSYFDVAIFNISLMGASLGHTSAESPEIVENAIYQKLGELGGSYGGFLSANVYGGFTRKQKDAILTYRKKFFPDIKISLLPIEHLSFVPLTDWQKNPDDKQAKLNSMFTNITGAGDYLGAALTMNMTISGAFGLAERLGPFIPPMGVSAVIREQLKPSEAELSCDFTKKFELFGSANVREDTVIYERTLSSLKVQDDSDGACSLKIISGDVDSSYIKALTHLENKFEEIGLRRTTLSKSEKEDYLLEISNNKSIQPLSDPTENPQPFGPEFVTSGPVNPEHVPTIMKAMKDSTGFYWHMNSEDVNKLRELKFKTRVSVNGYEKVKRQLPVDLCLIFNQELLAYDRCQDEEEEKALPMVQSIANASSSQLCEDIGDPFACGKLRAQSDEVAHRKPVPFLRDDEIVTNF